MPRQPSFSGSESRSESGSESRSRSSSSGSRSRSSSAKSSESGSRSRSESGSSGSRSESGSSSDATPTATAPSPRSPSGTRSRSHTPTPVSPSARSPTPGPPPPGIRSAIVEKGAWREPVSPSESRRDVSPNHRGRSPAATATRRFEPEKRIVQARDTSPHARDHGARDRAESGKDRRRKDRKKDKEEEKPVQRYKDAREEEAALHARMEEEHRAFMERAREEAARRKPTTKSGGLSPNAPKHKKMSELPATLRSAVGTFEELIRRKAEEQETSPTRQLAMTPTQARSVFNKNPEIPKEKPRDPDSPLPDGDIYTLGTSVSEQVKGFISKLKDVQSPGKPKAKAKPTDSKWRTSKPSANDDELEVAQDPKIPVIVRHPPATDRKPKKERSVAKRSAETEKKPRRHRQREERTFTDRVEKSIPMSPKISSSRQRPVAYEKPYEKSYAKYEDLRPTSVDNYPLGSATWHTDDYAANDQIPLSPSAHRAEIAGVKAFLETQLQSLRETLEVDAHAVELQLVQDEQELEEDHHSPSPVRQFAPRTQVESARPEYTSMPAGHTSTLMRPSYADNSELEEDVSAPQRYVEQRAASGRSNRDKVRGFGSTLKEATGESPASPEFQSPRSEESPHGPKTSALTELRKVAETSVARARELELACRELADRDQLVAELQERLDTVRNEYRGEVLTLRSDLSTVREHLEATRQEKSIMEEEFLQELARLEAERAELLGAKHFLEEQVGIVEKDAAVATAQQLETGDQCSRLEAQVKSLEAKLRHLGDISDQGKAQLVKTATSAEAKDAIIAELREQVKDLQRHGKRADSELKRLGSKLHHETQERDHFAEQIEGILSEFGITHKMPQRSRARDVTPTRVRDAPTR